MAVHFGGGRELGCVALRELGKLLARAMGSDADAKEPPSYASCANACAMLGRLCDFGLVSAALPFSVCDALLAASSTTSSPRGAPLEPTQRCELVVVLTRAASERLGSDDRERFRALPAQAEECVGAGARDLRASHCLDALRSVCAKSKRARTDDAKLERAKQLRRSVRKIAGKNDTAALRVTWAELADADQRGAWWRVGASWSGRETTRADGPAPTETRRRGGANKAAAAAAASSSDSSPAVSAAAQPAAEKLGKMAQEQRMNTPARRAAFVALMSSSDAQDAAYRCADLVQRGDCDEKDVATVALHCCGTEKAYNAFYAAFVDKRCADARSSKKRGAFSFALKLAAWDALKSLRDFTAPDGGARKAANLGKFLGAARPRSNGGISPFLSGFCSHLYGTVSGPIWTIESVFWKATGHARVRASSRSSLASKLVSTTLETQAPRSRATRSRFWRSSNRSNSRARSTPRTSSHDTRVRFV